MDDLVARFERAITPRTRVIQVCHITNLTGQIFPVKRICQLARSRGIETRGVSNHGFIRSVYFRDPNGYVIELTARTPSHDEAMDPARNGARAKLDRWTTARREAAKA